MSPSDSCSRALLNQPRYSTIASSSWVRLRQTRSVISSVLKLSTNDSASAFVVRVADGSDRGEHAAHARTREIGRASAFFDAAEGLHAGPR
jgi:hypothetical protein